MHNDFVNWCQHFDVVWIGEVNDLYNILFQVWEKQQDALKELCNSELQFCGIK